MTFLLNTLCLGIAYVIVISALILIYDGPQGFNDLFGRK